MAPSPRRCYATEHVRWWERSEVIQIAKEALEQHRREKMQCTSTHGELLHYLAISHGPIQKYHQTGFWHFAFACADTLGIA